MEMVFVAVHVVHTNSSLQRLSRGGAIKDVRLATMVSIQGLVVSTMSLPQYMRLLVRCQLHLPK